MADLPESRGILVVLLLVEMFHTIVQQSIVLGGGMESVSPTAAFISFSVILLLLLILACVSSVNIEGFGCHTVFSLCAQFVGAMLYFIGDNLDVVLVKENENETLKIAATVCIGLALVIFLLAPLASNGLKQVVDKKGLDDVKKGLDDKHRFLAIDTVTVILKVDVLYSAILALSNISDQCSNTSFQLSIAFIVVFTVLGWVYMLILAPLSNHESSPKRNGLVILCFILVFLSYPLYILMNNNLPLDCAFGCSQVVEGVRISTATPICNMTATNDTSALPCCDQLGNSITRLVSIIVAFLFLLLASFVFSAEYLDKYINDEEKMLAQEKRVPDDTKSESRTQVGLAASCACGACLNVGGLCSESPPRSVQSRVNKGFTCVLYKPLLCYGKRSNKVAPI